MHLNQWADAFGELLAGHPEALTEIVNGTNTFNIQQRLDVYRNNYQQGLINHLRQTFERCNGHVGEEYFAQLAIRYIHKYPPDAPGLQVYGNHFPQHLQTLVSTRPELSNMTYLPDLATADWLCDQVYYSPQRKSWPQQAFQQLDETQQTTLKLLMSPDCRLLQSHWPVSQLWELHNGQRTQLDIHYQESPEYLLIHRTQFRIRLEKLSAHIYFLLADVKNGMPLCQLTEHHPQGISHLPELITQGWIHDFEADTDTEISHA